MTNRPLFWTVLLFATLAPIGARAAFNPEEENPGQFNKVMDEKDKQEREAKFTILKREQAQADAARHAEAEVNSRELAQSFQQEVSHIDWAAINSWCFNLTMVGVVGVLAWFGWKHTMPRVE